MVEQDRLSVPRCALTAAVTLATLFLLCWFATLFWNRGASHMFIALFTPADPTSLFALATGICWALVFGALAGALAAVIFNFSGRWFSR